MNTVVPVS